MIELAQHIGALLLENDCVIVPGLGRFAAHYASAMRVAEENTFLPPTRTIGFNPQLEMNNGLLVQSYMAVRGTDSSDATKIADKTIEELLSLLHEDEKADLPNVGELRYSVHDTYDFVPHNNKITTSHLYGLDCFEVQELTVLRKPYDSKTVPFIPAVREERRRAYRIGINPSYLTGAVTMIAIVALFFFFFIPIENTEVMEANYTRLFPGDLSEQIEKQSLAITPIVVRQQPDTRKVRVSQVNLSQTADKKAVAPVAVGEMKVCQQPVAVSASRPETETAPTVSVPQPANMPYYIIIASISTEKDVNAMTQQLVAKGYAGAEAIIGDDKMRVSIQSYATEKEAYRVLNRTRLGETYQSA